MSTSLTIGQLAKAVGVNIQTVRYYERLKLLSPTARKESGYRVYGPTDVQRLRFIKNAQALGFRLKEIAELLSLRVTTPAQCQQVLARADAKLTQVHTKISELQGLAAALRGLIQVCQKGDRTEYCPILRSLEETARPRKGSPRRKGQVARSGQSRSVRRPSATDG